MRLTGMKKEGETHVNLREVRNLKEVIFFSPVIQIPILERYAILPMVKFRAGPPVI